MELDGGGSLDPTSAFVVSDDRIRGLDPARTTAHRCSRVDGFNLCVYDPDAPCPDPIIPYAAGDVSRIIREMNGRTLTWLGGPLPRFLCPVTATGWSAS
jgi:hypothetical protein